MQSREEKSKILTLDEAINGCSGAVLGSIVIPLFVVRAMTTPLHSGNTSPLTVAIFAIAALCLGALGGGLLGRGANKLVKRKLNRVETGQIDGSPNLGGMVNGYVGALVGGVLACLLSFIYILQSWEDEEIGVLTIPLLVFIAGAVGVIFGAVIGFFLNRVMKRKWRS